MGPGKDLDPFNQLRFAGDRAMVVPVRANEISQHLGVTAVRFGPRDSVAVPIPGRGHRVDGVDLVARTHQCGHEQAPVYLDAWSPMSSCNSAMPFTESGTRRLLITVPDSSITQTS